MATKKTTETTVETTTEETVVETTEMTVETTTEETVVETTESTATVTSDIEAEAPKFTRKQLMGAKRFANRRDLVGAICKEGKTYTIAEVEAAINDYLAKER